jgi:predicted site-specific integrase-resolvase
MIGLTPKQAAARLKKSVLTLHRWRKKEGVGPPFKVVNGRIYYPPREFMDWLEKDVRV